MSRPYQALVGHLVAAISELERLGLGESLAKGRVGEVLLAHHLDHELVVGDKGADGRAADGKKYEYKVSTIGSDQYNFNFGHADRRGLRSDLVERHFDGYEGAYCALASGGRLTKIVYCPIGQLLPFLKEHVEAIVGQTTQKNFSTIEKFAEVSGSTWVLGEPPSTDA